AATFNTCWEHHNRGEWMPLEHCYTKTAAAESPGRAQVAVGPEIADAARSLHTDFPDLRGEPQLVLVDGAKLVAAVRLSGKHAKLGKSIGVLGGVVLDYDAAGLVTHESDYFDAGTITSQLVPSETSPARAWDSATTLAKQTVVAAHDAKEAANVAAVNQAVAAFGRHDFAGFGALLADDATWSDQTKPVDATKTQVIAELQAVTRSFPDIAMTVQDLWGAGDYVVEIGELRGTNDGDIRGALTPTHKKIAVPYLAIHQVIAGKLAHTWVFEQGDAIPRQLGLK
ncbi:MAG: nuclear transport factor 2 family protein, partial [Kofleriaceae bacterium]